MASITSPEQGAQQEWSKTLRAPLGAWMGLRFFKVSTVIVHSKNNQKLAKIGPLRLAPFGQILLGNYEEAGRNAPSLNFQIDSAIKQEPPFDGAVSVVD